MSAALRTLRVQVSIALLVAAAACAYLTAKSSADELAGAYRESGRELLATVERSYASDVDAQRLAQPEALRRDLSELVRLHPRIMAATVYRDGANGPVAVAARGPRGLGGNPSLALQAITERGSVGGETRRGDHHVEWRVGTLAGGSGALGLAYDLRPADAAVAGRNTRIAVVLTFLLLGFTAFTAFVLGWGIFTPLGKLGAATRRIADGDLDSRLGWARRDELGLLAADFDTMADQLEEKHQRLETLALRDPLTGLANHRRFQEALVEEIERAEREGQPLSLVVLDIDRFKSVNDTHGHPFGDAVLAAVGGALRSTLRRQGGLVARLGGDEFGLVLPYTDGSRASAIADAARAACASASPRDFEITCSAGIACFPDDAGSADALIQLADGALYWAKGSGRSRTRRYDAEHVMVVTDEQRAEFADLLTRPDCVRPVFQPIVCLRSGSIVGYEALARFEGKPGLPPAWWFRQAHRFGLGHRLEAEAIGAALRAGERPDGAFLSVNVSPSALESPEVQELLPDNLEGLIIEITEEERIGDAVAFAATLNDLRDRGARVAVDDAGAGYAGLQQVMHMKADVIKLDRALVTDVHTDPAKVALISALVQFGGSTGARICAEGIESLEELRALIPLGVDYAQGFRLARPAAPWADIDPEARRVCTPPEGRGRVIELHPARLG